MFGAHPPERDLLCSRCGLNLMHSASSHIGWSSKALPRRLQYCFSCPFSGSLRPLLGSVLTSRWDSPASQTQRRSQRCVLFEDSVGGSLILCVAAAGPTPRPCRPGMCLGRDSNLSLAVTRRGAKAVRSKRVLNE